MKGIKSFLMQNWLFVVIVAGAVWLFVYVKQKGLLGALGSIIGGSSVDVPVPKKKGLISDEKAKSLADRMFNAFNYFWGTDLQELNYVYEEIIKIPGSIVDVSNAFGVRRYAISGYGFFASLGLGSDLNLYGWLVEELSAKDMEKWRVLFNNAGL